MRAVVLYAITTLIAIVFGIALMHSLELGKELHLSQVAPTKVKPLPSIAELVSQHCPKRPAQCSAEGNVLQIIVFSTFFGIALNLAGAKAKPVVTFLQGVQRRHVPPRRASSWPFRPSASLHLWPGPAAPLAWRTFASAEVPEAHIGLPAWHLP